VYGQDEQINKRQLVTDTCNLKGAPKVEGGGGLPLCSPLPENPHNRNLKEHKFCRYYDIRILRDLPFSRNQTLKSADDYYVRILKNKLIRLKKQEDRTL
jgi:hypothetical protein